MSEEGGKPRQRLFSLTRDSILFFLGVGTFVYIIISGDTRAPLLYSALALMGVGAALRGFTVVRDNGNGA